MIRAGRVYPTGIIVYDNAMAKLYIVATPIGNLEDITLRALRILGEVDIVLCEDTRVTKKLLQKYSIATPTLSYHVRSGAAKTEKIIRLLEAGKALALVSDAGTPTISDPGVFLVRKLREHFKTGITIIAIPGASAVTAALSVSGVPSSEFLFLGFLPHKKGREKLFKEITESKRTVIFYESPHRILKTLESLNSCLPEDKEVVITRELTKMHEEIVVGTAGEVCLYFKNNPDKVKGEFSVVVGCKKTP